MHSPSYVYAKNYRYVHYYSIVFTPDPVWHGVNTKHWHWEYLWKHIWGVWCYWLSLVSWVERWTEREKRECSNCHDCFLYTPISIPILFVFITIYLFSILLSLTIFLSFSLSIFFFPFSSQLWHAVGGGVWRFEGCLGWSNDQKCMVSCRKYHKHSIIWTLGQLSSFLL